jgi:hypothetical protein
VLSLDYIAGREIPRVNRRLRREGRALGASAPVFTHQITHRVKTKNAPKAFAHGAFTHSPKEVHKIHYILKQAGFLFYKLLFFSCDFVDFVAKNSFP